MAGEGTDEGPGRQRQPLSDAEARDWQADHPPPPSMTAREIRRLLAAHFPGRAGERLFAMARAAIGLWPQRPPAHLAPVASRWGGLPLVPPGWSWPVYEDRSLFFLGQINCAELRGLSAAAGLPDAGMLSIFADFEAVGGIDPFGDARMFYWPDVGRLQPVGPPADLEQIYPLAALVFRPLIDLPYPHSDAVDAILPEPDLVRRYFDVFDIVTGHGLLPELRDNFWYSGSKLFGWPHLVQSELDSIHVSAGEAAPRLLLQIDPYSNGNESEGWGPGGKLYFLIRDADLRQRRFDKVEFEMQCT